MCCVFCSVVVNLKLLYLNPKCVFSSELGAVSASSSALQLLRFF